MCSLITQIPILENEPLRVLPLSENRANKRQDAQDPGQSGY